jgi:hypothetical protein
MADLSHSLAVAGFSRKAGGVIYHFAGLYQFIRVARHFISRLEPTFTHYRSGPHLFVYHYRR